MNTAYSVSSVSIARNPATIGDEVCWLDQTLQEFPPLADIDASEYLDLGNYDDPKHAFAIEGHEISLKAEMNDIGQLLEDEQRLYIF